jgi:hypothetical protein
MRAMDVLFQFVVEVVLEIFGELLFEAGLEGAGRVLRNRCCVTRSGPHSAWCSHPLGPAAQWWPGRG